MEPHHGRSERLELPLFLLREDTRPSANQEVGPHQTPDLPALQSWNARPPDCEKEMAVVYAIQSMGFLLQQLKLTKIALEFSTLALHSL